MSKNADPVATALEAVARTETLLSELESGSAISSATQVREAVDEFQRACQHLGNLAAHYPDSEATKRAAQIVLEGRRTIYGRRLSQRQVRENYLTRLRTSFHAMRWHIALAFAIAVGTAAATAFLIAINPQLGWHFLNEDAVAALKKGRLWTEQIQGIESIAAAGIMTNNITVSFMAFASGATAGVLTVVVLISNGAHLGGVFAVLGQYGMAGRLLDFIVAHGFLELSIIFVAAGAGFYIGDAILNPGDRTRSDALRLHAWKALDVVLFSAAWLVVAGLVEGYISPHEIPFTTKASLGIFIASVYWYLLAGRSRKGES